MPRKKINSEEKVVKEKAVSTAKKTTSKVAKSSSTTKKSASKTSKTSTSTKKVASKTAKAKSTTKKTTTKKPSTSKSTTKKAKKSNIVEYYDLPLSYDNTLVKILYQTPTKLFVYWELSSAQADNYRKEFGEDFFNNTKPVLIVRNETKNYSFEVDINDFANSWYLNVPDAKCNYSIELGRRVKENINYSIPNNFVSISSSNTVESPNDHILFDKEQKMVYFKNVKTNEITSKNIANFNFIRNIGKIYNIYDYYKTLYKDDEELLSNISSSTFK